MDQLRVSANKLEVLFTTSGRRQCSGQSLDSNQTVPIDRYRISATTYNMGI